MKLSELTTAISDTVYHGTPELLDGELRREPHGVYFTPHVKWAKQYGNHVYACRVYANNVYMIDYDEDIDIKIIDALFDRDYVKVTEYIQFLKGKGYQAMQTETDSAMIIAFDNAVIQVIGLVE